MEDFLVWLLAIDREKSWATFSYNLFIAPSTKLMTTGARVIGRSRALLFASTID